MAATPAAKNSVHWAPSPNLSPLSDSLSQSSSSSSFTSSSSTIQYINSQLISHGFAVQPGLSLDGLSTADAENVTKCLLSMLSQRVEDMTRAEELTTKLRTLSYDHERLRTMHGAATETAENAEREAAAARAKLTIANRAQTQAEAAHKQTTGDLQRARTALQALRATHVAEIKKREKEIEAIRERWSKLADAQLRISSLPSGMVFLGAPANASVLVEGNVSMGAGVGVGGGSKKGVVEGALEEAEKARAVLKEENLELKGLVVDAANAVRKILHKAISSDPDNLEFPPPLAANDLFPLGARDAAFERLSALLTSLRDALTTLRASDTPPNAAAGASESEPKKSQISLAELVKKAAESDAKAHKWEVEELRNTIAGLQGELKRVKAEKKLASTSRFQDIPTAEQTLASYLPPTVELVGAGPAPKPQHEMEAINPEPNTKQGDAHREQHTSKRRELLFAARPERPALPTTSTAVAAAEPAPSRVSPRKTRSKAKVKVKTKPVHKSPLKAARTSRASPASTKKRSGTRPRRLTTTTTTNKRIEASFETEVIPSTVPVSLLPTSFVLPPPSPESRLPRAPQPPPPSTHPTSFLTSFPSSVPPLLFPSTSTTPPFSPPVQQSTPWPPHMSAVATSTETQKITVPCVPPIPTAAGTYDSEPHHSPPPPPSPGTSSRPFPLAKPMARNMSHAYSPVKPSPLSRILMLAASPESTGAVAHSEPQMASTVAPVLGGDARDLHPPPGTNAFVSGITPAPVFERPPPPPPPPIVASMAPVPATVTQAAPAPLRTDTTSNTAGPQRRRSSTRKRTSLEAELDLDADADANGDSRPPPTSKNKPNAKDPRAPEKENTIRRRLRQGPAAGRNANANLTANANAARGGGVKTRKMAAAAAATTTKATSVKPAPAPAPAPAPTAMSDHDHEPAAEVGRMGGAASRLLLAAARGSAGPRRVPIDSTEAAAGVQARRVS